MRHVIGWAWLAVAVGCGGDSAGQDGASDVDANGSEIADGRDGETALEADVETDTQTIATTDTADIDTADTADIDTADTAHTADTDAADADTADTDTAESEVTPPLECEPGWAACGDACVAETAEACGSRCLACPTPVGGTSACNAGWCESTCNPITSASAVGPWCQAFASTVVASVHAPSRALFLDRDGALVFVGGGVAARDTLYLVRVASNPTVETAIAKAPDGARIQATALDRDAAGAPHAAFTYSNLASPIQYGVALVRPNGDAFATLPLLPLAALRNHVSLASLAAQRDLVVTTGLDGAIVLDVDGVTVTDVSPGDAASNVQDAQLAVAPSGRASLLIQYVNDTCRLMSAPTAGPTAFAWTLDRAFDCQAATFALGPDEAPRLAFTDTTVHDGLIDAQRGTDGSWTDAFVLASHEGAADDISLAFDAAGGAHLTFRSTETLFYASADTIDTQGWRTALRIGDSHRLAAPAGIVVGAGGIPFIIGEKAPNYGVALHTPPCQAFQECGGICGACQNGEACVHGGLCEP